MFRLIYLKLARAPLVKITFCSLGFEERSPDSLENSGDSKTAAKNDNEDVSLVSAQSERDSGTIARSDSKGDLEGDRGTIGDIHSRESSVSNYGHPSTVKSHAEPLRLVNPGTTDTRYNCTSTYNHNISLHLDQVGLYYTICSQHLIAGDDKSRSSFSCISYLL